MDESKSVMDAIPETPQISNGQRKKMRKQQQEFTEMFKRYNERRARDQKRLRAESDRMRVLLGKEDYTNLRDICTVHTPEQKNEAGEVTAKATSFVNHRALVTEAKLVLALKREERIVSGKRKRTTGRGSDRAAHIATVKFIDNRNKVTMEKEPLKT